MLFSFCLNSLKKSFHYLLTPVVFDEKAALLCFFFVVVFLAAFMVFLFTDFQQFESSMYSFLYIIVKFSVYFTWVYLSFLDLWIYTLIEFSKIFKIYFSFPSYFCSSNSVFDCYTDHYDPPHYK